MFYVIFGLLWMMVSFYMIKTTYDPGNTSVYKINEEVVTYEEFIQEPSVYLFLGFVFLLGFIIFLVGVRIIVRDHLTHKRGNKTIGILVNIVPNGQIINEEEVLDVIFLVLEKNGECNIYRKNIGMNDGGYTPGDFFEVQCYKNNITILSYINEDMVPIEQSTILKNAFYSHKNPYYHG